MSTDPGAKSLWTGLDDNLSCVFPVCMVGKTGTRCSMLEGFSEKVQTYDPELTSYGTLQLWVLIAQGSFSFCCLATPVCSFLIPLLSCLCCVRLQGCKVVLWLDRGDRKSATVYSDVCASRHALGVEELGVWEVEIRYREKCHSTLKRTLKTK